MTKRVVVLLALLVPLKLASLMSAAERRVPIDPIAQIKRGADISDVWSTGPVRLRMRVRFLAVKAGAIDAEYEKASASWQQWRATFSSPEFASLAVGGDGQVWDAQSGEKPIRVWQFERALSALSQSVVSDKLQYTVRVRQIDEGGPKVPCVQIKGEVWSGQDCFDPTSGVLLRAQENSLTYLFSDYKPLGGKLFPHTIYVFEGFTLVSTAHVVELDVPAKFDSNLFSPPAGVSPYPVCKEALGLALEPRGGKLRKAVQPTSPSLPPNSGILSNDMIVTAIVGREGQLHNISAGGTNPRTKEATLEAMRVREYEPFTVCGNPVELPIEFTVNFSKTGIYLGP